MGRPLVLSVSISVSASGGWPCPPRGLLGAGVWLQTHHYNPGGQGSYPLPPNLTFSGRVGWAWIPHPLCVHMGEGERVNWEPPRGVQVPVEEQADNSPDVLLTYPEKFNQDFQPEHGRGDGLCLFSARLASGHTGCIVIPEVGLAWGSLTWTTWCWQARDLGTLQPREADQLINNICSKGVIAWCEVCEVGKVTSAGMPGRGSLP